MRTTMLSDKDWLKLRGQLQEALQKFPKVRADHFIQSAGALLNEWAILNKYTDPKLHRQLLVRIDRRLESVKRDMGDDGQPQPAALPARLHVLRSRYVRIDGDAEQIRSDEFYRSQREFLSAVVDYQRNVRLALKLSAKPSRGRESADRNGLFAEIADSFNRLLDTKPTSTPGGAFSNVVLLIVQAQERNKRADVSKIVRAAIRNMGR